MGGTHGLRIGSMFSGYGGLDRAVENVFGATPAWFCEWDKAPTKVLNHHWPHVPNHRDVTQINWHDVEPVDILTAGYPCQPFSTAGHRKGTHDERHLWPYVHTAIRILRPRYVVLENVTGHLNLGFNTVLADLAKIGFNAEWATIRAADVGAPHHRDRLFILAYPNSVGLQAEQLTSRPTPKVTWDNNRERALSWAGYAADLTNQLGARVAAWALIYGYPPTPTVEHVTYREPELFKHRFPEVKHGINPEFVEWIMGLPQGWVTNPEIGLSRAQQLKMLGNGVCPPQAQAALTALTARLRQAGSTP